MYRHKNILITGASSGLGRNLALNYAKEGGRIINISRSLPKMESLQKELIQESFQEHLYFSGDVSKYQEILDIQKELRQQKISPDVIINNAAGNFLCPFNQLTPNGWNRVIDIVLNGTFNIYHLFGKQLIQEKKSGVFLNISTTYSETGSALVIPSSVA